VDSILEKYYTISYPTMDPHHPDAFVGSALLALSAFALLLSLRGLLLFTYPSDPSFQVLAALSVACYIIGCTLVLI
jgi:hypothetical protein